MVRRIRYDWSALKVEFTERCLQGEGLSVRDFLQERGVGVSRTTLDKRTAGWVRDVEATRRRITLRDIEGMELNQLKERQLLRKRRNRLIAVAEEMETLYLEKLDHVQGQDVAERKWCPSASDLRAVNKVIEELTVTGAGLPKVHDVRVDDSQDEVMANREQQRALRAKAQSILTYCREHGMEIPDPDKVY